MALRSRPVPAKQRKVVRPPARAVRLDIRYVREIISELKKVTWPSRETATNLTVVVIAVSLVVGLFLGGFDYAFSWLVNTVLVPK